MLVTMMGGRSASLLLDGLSNIQPMPSYDAEEVCDASLEEFKAKYPDWGIVDIND